MKAEDWVGVGIRVAGVLIFLSAMGLLLDSLLLKLGYFQYPDTSPAYYLIYGVVQAVAGLYLIRGASFVIEFAFPNGNSEESEREVG